jgi:hypothetical protein
MGTSQCEGNFYRNLKIISVEQRLTGLRQGTLISFQGSRDAAQKSVAEPSDWIHSLMTTFKKALDEDKLQGIKGIGPKTLDTMRHYVSKHESRD